MSSRFLVRLVAAASLALIGACEGSAAPTTTTIATTAETTTTAAATSTTRLERPYWFQTCANRIGEGYGDPDVELAIFDVGAVSFLGLDTQETASMAASMFEPDADGRYRVLEYVTVVDRSVIGSGPGSRPVDLKIDLKDLTSAGLVYDPSLWAGGTPAAADHWVRFEGCLDRDAQFAGGFVVTEKMCLPITVIEWRDPPRVSFGVIPFGVPSETCRLPGEG